jgi:hypothetical protein
MKHEPDTLWLQPGQPQSIHVARDSHVLVDRGGVSIVLPSEGWMALGLRATVTVPAGSAQPMRRAGWIELTALGPRPAQVRLLGARPRGLHHLGPLARLGGDQPGEGWRPARACGRAARCP